MRALRYCVRRSARRACGAAGSRALLSTATIALALFVLGGFLLVTANLERLGAEWSERRRDVGVPEATTSTRGAAARDRSACSTPARSSRGREYVSKAEALARFTADVRRSVAGVDGPRRQSAAGVLRSAAPNRRRGCRQAVDAWAAGCADAGRRRRALRPAVADAAAVGDRRGPRRRARARRDPDACRRADGRQRRPARAVRAARRDRDHAARRRAAALRPRAVRHGRACCRAASARWWRSRAAGASRCLRAARTVSRAARVGGQPVVDPFPARSSCAVGSCWAGWRSAVSGGAGGGLERQVRPQFTQS